MFSEPHYWFSSKRMPIALKLTVELRTAKWKVWIILIRWFGLAKEKSQYCYFGKLADSRCAPNVSQLNCAPNMHRWIMTTKKLLTFEHLKSFGSLKKNNLSHNNYITWVISCPVSTMLWSATWAPHCFNWAPFLVYSTSYFNLKVHSLTHWLTDSLTHWLTDSLTRWLADSL